MQLISNYSNYFNKVEENFIDFKRKQEEEKEQLTDTLNTITIAIEQQQQRGGIYRQYNSNFVLNDQYKSMNSLSLAVSSNQLNVSPSSAFVKKRTTTPTPQVMPVAQPTSTDQNNQTVYQLHQTPTNKSFGTSKTGYLLKHSLRSRMRKHWLKRKCVVENGLFLIYHSDVIFQLF